MVACPMIYLMCQPGEEHFKWDPSMGGCNPYPCSNLAPCFPCKNLSNCEGGPLIAVDPIPIPPPQNITSNFSLGLNNQSLSLQNLTIPAVEPF